jgi:ABC-2 type transport system permease protein
MRHLRSELTRLRRKSFVLGWFGISALFVVMINTFVFKAAADGTTVPSNAPGGSFPGMAELVRPDGFVAGLGAAGTLLGVVTLSFWAIATATDYSTGLIRLLVQAEPRRLRLLLGKIGALTGWTAAVACVALAVTLVVAPAAARGAGVSTAAWTVDIGTVGSAWLNLFLALLVWGVIGLVIGVIARSSTVAISVGVGYVLVVEGVVKLAASGAAEWLPGSTLTALAQGGTATVAYGTAVALGVAYATIGLAAAAATFKRRDILD